MIRYALACSACAHRYDAWFANAAAYDEQAAAALVTCPLCASNDVAKAPMAPAIGGHAAKVERAATMMAAMRALTAKVKAEAEPVGVRFPEEARRIHYGEAEERPIWGQASRDDAKALVDEGIEVAPLPDLPEPDA
ncbi:MAG: DUF1178 family protein [Pseudomonadota bacterium]